MKIALHDKKEWDGVILSIIVIMGTRLIETVLKFLRVFKWIYMQMEIYCPLAAEILWGKKSRVHNVEADGSD